MVGSRVIGLEARDDQNTLILLEIDVRNFGISELAALEEPGHSGEGLSLRKACYGHHGAYVWILISLSALEWTKTDRDIG